MKEKISNGMKYLNFSIWMVASLLVFLSVGMLFALFIAQSISINASTMGLLNLSFLIILVFVTMIYVILTGKNVDETKTDRKVAFIERRLEKLYYPLREILRDYLFENNSQKDLYEIIPYTYLASEKLKKEFNQFHMDFRIDEFFEDESVEEMLDIIEGDIEILNEKLNKIMDA